MRTASLLSAVLSFAMVLPLVSLAGCSDDKTMDADPFDTLQDCYDDHHNEESLPVQEAIVVCCLDHPIAGVHPSCKDTQTDCALHLSQELDTSVSASDIQAACATYLMQK